MYLRLMDTRSPARDGCGWGFEDAFPISTSGDIRRSSVCAGGSGGDVRQGRRRKR